MSYVGLSVTSYIEPYTIASEFINDTDLAFEVLIALDEQTLDPKIRARFVKEICTGIFEEEHTGILGLFSEILEAFAHLEEKDE